MMRQLRIRTGNKNTADIHVKSVEKVQPNCASKARKALKVCNVSVLNNKRGLRPRCKIDSTKTSPKKKQALLIQPKRTLEQIWNSKPCNKRKTKDKENLPPDCIYDFDLELEKEEKQVISTITKKGFLGKVKKDVTTSVKKTEKPKNKPLKSKGVDNCEQKNKTVKPTKCKRNVEKPENVVTNGKTTITSLKNGSKKIPNVCASRNILKTEQNGISKKLGKGNLKDAERSAAKKVTNESTDARSSKSHHASLPDFSEIFMGLQQGFTSTPNRDQNDNGLAQGKPTKRKNDEPKSNIQSKQRRKVKPAGLNILKDIQNIPVSNQARGISQRNAKAKTVPIKQNPLNNQVKEKPNGNNRQKLESNKNKQNLEIITLSVPIQNIETHNLTVDNSVIQDGKQSCPVEVPPSPAHSDISAMSDCSIELFYEFPDTDEAAATVEVEESMTKPKKDYSTPNRSRVFPIKDVQNLVTYHLKAQKKKPSEAKFDAWACQLNTHFDDIDNSDLIIE